MMVTMGGIGVLSRSRRVLSFERGMRADEAQGDDSA